MARPRRKAAALTLAKIAAAVSTPDSTASKEEDETGEGNKQSSSNEGEKAISESKSESNPQPQPEQEKENATKEASVAATAATVASTTTTTTRRGRRTTRKSSPGKTATAKETTKKATADPSTMGSGESKSKGQGKEAATKKPAAAVASSDGPKESITPKGKKGTRKKSITAKSKSPTAAGATDGSAATTKTIAATTTKTATQEGTTTADSYSSVASPSKVTGPSADEATTTESARVSGVEKKKSATVKDDIAGGVEGNAVASASATTTTAAKGGPKKRVGRGKQKRGQQSTAETTGAKTTAIKSGAKSESRTSRPASSSPAAAAAEDTTVLRRSKRRKVSTIEKEQEQRRQEQQKQITSSATTRTIAEPATSTSALPPTTSPSSTGGTALITVQEDLAAVMMLTLASAPLSTLSKNTAAAPAVTEATTTTTAATKERAPVSSHLGAWGATNPAAPVAPFLSDQQQQQPPVPPNSGSSGMEHRMTTSTTTKRLMPNFSATTTSDTSSTSGSGTVPATKPLASSLDANEVASATGTFAQCNSNDVSVALEVFADDVTIAAVPCRSPSTSWPDSLFPSSHLPPAEVAAILTALPDTCSLAATPAAATTARPYGMKGDKASTAALATSEQEPPSITSSAVVVGAVGQESALATQIPTVTTEMKESRNSIESVTTRAAIVHDNKSMTRRTKEVDSKLHKTEAQAQQSGNDSKPSLIVEAPAADHGRTAASLHPKKMTATISPKMMNELESHPPRSEPSDTSREVGVPLSSQERESNYEDPSVATRDDDEKDQQQDPSLTRIVDERDQQPGVVGDLGARSKNELSCGTEKDLKHHQEQQQDRVLYETRENPKTVDEEKDAHSISAHDELPQGGSVNKERVLLVSEFGANADEKPIHPSINLGVEEKSQERPGSAPELGGLTDEASSHPEKTCAAVVGSSVADESKYVDKKAKDEPIAKSEQQDKAATREADQTPMALPGETVETLNNSSIEGSITVPSQVEERDQNDATLTRNADEPVMMDSAPTPAKELPNNDCPPVHGVSSIEGEETPHEQQAYTAKLHRTDDCPDLGTGSELPNQSIKITMTTLSKDEINLLSLERRDERLSGGRSSVQPGEGAEGVLDHSSDATIAQTSIVIEETSNEKDGLTENRPRTEEAIATEDFTENESILHVNEEQTGGENVENKDQEDAGKQIGIEDNIEAEDLVNDRRDDCTTLDDSVQKCSLYESSMLATKHDDIDSPTESKENRTALADVADHERKTTSCPKPTEKGEISAGVIRDNEFSHTRENKMSGPNQVDSAGIRAMESGSAVSSTDQVTGKGNAAGSGLDAMSLSLDDARVLETGEVSASLTPHFAADPTGTQLDDSESRKAITEVVVRQATVAVFATPRTTDPETETIGKRDSTETADASKLVTTPGASTQSLNRSTATFASALDDPNPPTFKSSTGETSNKAIPVVDAALEVAVNARAKGLSTQHMDEGRGDVPHEDTNVTEVRSAESTPASRMSATAEGSLTASGDHIVIAISELADPLSSADPDEAAPVSAIETNPACITMKLKGLVETDGSGVSEAGRSHPFDNDIISQSLRSTSYDTRQVFDDRLAPDDGIAKEGEQTWRIDRIVKEAEQTSRSAAGDAETGMVDIAISVESDKYSSAKTEEANADADSKAVGTIVARDRNLEFAKSSSDMCFGETPKSNTSVEVDEKSKGLGDTATTCSDREQTLQRNLKENLTAPMDASSGKEPKEDKGSEKECVSSTHGQSAVVEERAEKKTESTRVAAADASFGNSFEGEEEQQAAVAADQRPAFAERDEELKKAAGWTSEPFSGRAPLFKKTLESYHEPSTSERRANESSHKTSTLERGEELKKPERTAGAASDKAPGDRRYGGGHESTATEHVQNACTSLEKTLVGGKESKTRERIAPDVPSVEAPVFDKSIGGDVESKTVERKQDEPSGTSLESTLVRGSESMTAILGVSAENTTVLAHSSGGDKESNLAERTLGEPSVGATALEKTLVGGKESETPEKRIAVACVEESVLYGGGQESEMAEHELSDEATATEKSLAEGKESKMTERLVDISSENVPPRDNSTECDKEPTTAKRIVVEPSDEGTAFEETLAGKESTTRILGVYPDKTPVSHKSSEGDEEFRTRSNEGAALEKTLVAEEESKTAERMVVDAPFVEARNFENSLEGGNKSKRADRMLDSSFDTLVGTEEPKAAASICEAPSVERQVFGKCLGGDEELRAGDRMLDKPSDGGTALKKTLVLEKTLVRGKESMTVETSVDAPSVDASMLEKSSEGDKESTISEQILNAPLDEGVSFEKTLVGAEESNTSERIVEKTLVGRKESKTSERIVDASSDKAEVFERSAEEPILNAPYGEVTSSEKALAGAKESKTTGRLVDAPSVEAPVTEKLRERDTKSKIGQSNVDSYSGEAPVFAKTTEGNEKSKMTIGVVVALSAEALVEQRFEDGKEPKSVERNTDAPRDRSIELRKSLVIEQESKTAETKHESPNVGETVPGKDLHELRTIETNAEVPSDEAPVSRGSSEVDEKQVVPDNRQITVSGKSVGENIQVALGPVVPEGEMEEREKQGTTDGHSVRAEASDSAEAVLAQNEQHSSSCVGRGTCEDLNGKVRFDDEVAPNSAGDQNEEVEEVRFAKTDDDTSKIQPEDSPCVDDADHSSAAKPGARARDARADVVQINVPTTSPKSSTTSNVEGAWKHPESSCNQNKMRLSTNGAEPNISTGHDEVGDKESGLAEHQEQSPKGGKLAIPSTEMDENGAVLPTAGDKGENSGESLNLETEVVSRSLVPTKIAASEFAGNRDSTTSSRSPTPKDPVGERIGSKVEVERRPHNTTTLVRGNSAAFIEEPKAVIAAPNVCISSEGNSQSRPETVITVASTGAKSDEPADNDKKRSFAEVKDALLLAKRLKSDRGGESSRGDISVNSFDFEQTKLRIYTEGSAVHRVKEYDRKFADYWEAMRMRFDGGNSSEIVEKSRSAINCFLKTRRLRKLHNKLIKGTHQTCMFAMRYLLAS